MHEFIHKHLSGTILECYYDVYNKIGIGFDKEIYINSLGYALKNKGLEIEKYKEIEIRFDGKIVGRKKLDLVVNQKILLGITTKIINQKVDEIILSSQLKQTNIEVGLLLNFGEKPFQRRLIKPNNT